MSELKVELDNLQKLLKRKCPKAAPITLLQIWSFVHCLKAAFSELNC